MGINIHRSAIVEEKGAILLTKTAFLLRGAAAKFQPDDLRSCSKACVNAHCPDPAGGVELFFLTQLIQSVGVIPAELFLVEVQAEGANLAMMTVTRQPKLRSAGFGKRGHDVRAVFENEQGGQKIAAFR